MTKVEVKVLPEDIEKGVRRNAAKCPLARAFKRAFKDKLWSVGVYMAWADFGNQTITLPPEARMFRANFDTHRPVAPFTFEVEVPDAYLS